MQILFRGCIDVGGRCRGLPDKAFDRAVWIQCDSPQGEYDVGDRDHLFQRQDQGLRRCAENPGVEVVIDLHRDGVAESTRLVTQVNGIQMAQVMFLTG